jgi:hypothetical protein
MAQAPALGNLPQLEPAMGPPVDFRDWQFRRDVAALHRLGPRVLYEFLAELACRRLIRTEIEALAARYARIDPAILDALGGER